MKRRTERSLAALLSIMMAMSLLFGGMGTASAAPVTQQEDEIDMGEMVNGENPTVDAYFTGTASITNISDAKQKLFDGAADDGHIVDLRNGYRDFDAGSDVTGNCGDIVFHFKSQEVSLTKVQLWASANNYASRINGFQVFGSADGQTWEEITKKVDKRNTVDGITYGVNSEEAPEGTEKELNAVNANYYSYIRLLNTTNNSYGTIGEAVFFGSVRDAEAEPEPEESLLPLTKDNVGVYIAAKDGGREVTAGNSSGFYDLYHFNEKRKPEQDANEMLFDEDLETVINYGDTRTVIIDTGGENEISKVEIYKVSTSANFATSNVVPPETIVKTEPVDYQVNKVIRMNADGYMKDGYNISMSNVTRDDTKVTISGIEFDRFLIIDSARSKFDVAEVKVYTTGEKETVDLSQLKEEAKTALNQYLPQGASQDDYSEEKWAEIERIRTEGAAAIDEAADQGAIDTALAQAKAEIDKVYKKDEEIPAGMEVVPLTADAVGVYIAPMDGGREVTLENTSGFYDLYHFNEKRAASADNNGKLFDNDLKTTINYGNTRTVIIDTGEAADVTRVDIFNVSTSVNFATSNVEPPATIEKGGNFDYQVNKVIRMHSADQLKDGYNLPAANVRRNGANVTISGIEFDRYIILDAARTTFDVAEVRVLTGEDVAGQLQAAKDRAKAELNAYLPDGATQDSYTEDNWALVVQARENGATAIDQAADEGQVAEALAEAKGVIDGIEQIKEADDLPQKKQEAIETIQGTLTRDAYDAFAQNSMDTIIADAVAQINLEATNTEEKINQIRDAAVARLQALLNKEQAAAADKTQDAQLTTTSQYNLGTRDTIEIRTNEDKSQDFVGVLKFPVDPSKKVKQATLRLVSERTKEAAKQVKITKFQSEWNEKNIVGGSNYAQDAKSSYEYLREQIDASRGTEGVVADLKGETNKGIFESTTGQISDWVTEIDVTSLIDAGSEEVNFLISKVNSSTQQTCIFSNDYASYSNAGRYQTILQMLQSAGLEASYLAPTLTIEYESELPPVEYTIGDVNNDGEIGLADAVLTLQISVETVSEEDKLLQPYLSADVDKSGNVDVDDVLKVLKKANGKEVPDVDWAS